MSQSISRRRLVKGAAAATAAAVVPVTAMSAEPQSPPLAKPLPADVKKLYDAQIEQGKTNAKERLKFKLTDCSEPCTAYVGTEK